MSEGTYILHTDQKLLHDWARVVHDLFQLKNYGPYHVGSSLERKDYRDVDLRVIMPDKDFDRLSKMVDIEMLGIAISLWGQKATGLPIDYQIQRMTDANREYEGKQRNAVWIGD